MPAPLLALRAITKRFPGVTALGNVCLSVDRGEVLALLGEDFRRHYNERRPKRGFLAVVAFL